MTTQTEEAAITEEDLELIKERETNIRQLEVSLCLLFLLLKHTRTQWKTISPHCGYWPLIKSLSLSRDHTPAPADYSFWSVSV